MHLKNFLGNLKLRDPIKMRFILKSVFFGGTLIVLSKLSYGQDSKEILDLIPVADLLDFPKSELILTPYLEETKFIYTRKDVTEQSRGRMPPVNPASIYQAYQITSKTPNAFLPIIITVSKRDAYITPYVQNFMLQANALPDLPIIQKGRLPFGKFDLSGASSAIFYMEQIRVPAHSNEKDQPGNMWFRKDDRPKTHPAVVSIVQDALSEVDIRIAQYSCLYDSNQLVKVAGGEEYFETFYEEVESDPKEPPREARKEVPILDIFKGLNQIVLNSPIMDPYRTAPVVPPNTQNLSTEEAAKVISGSSGIQNVHEPSPPVVGDSSKWGLPAWVYLLLFLVGAGGVTAWLWKTRG